MIEPTLSHYLLISGALFSIGLLGVIVRRNILIIYMSLELMLNAANVALVAMSRFNGNLDGQVMVFFISSRSLRIYSVGYFQCFSLINPNTLPCVEFRLPCTHRL